MVNETEKREIQKKMRRIKDAKDDEGKTKSDIEARTQELVAYLRKRGLMNNPDE